MNRLLSIIAFGLFMILSSQNHAEADSFGSDSSSFTIDFVTIGNPGNLPDTTGSPNPAGSVPYAYRMGKYEISEQMIDKANALGALGLVKDTRGPDKPATSLSWFDAANFVNWLNTSTGHAPAYKFDSGGAFQLWLPSDPGYDANNLFRNSQAKYFLPSANEWYKAAFYDPSVSSYWDFPTGSNSAPVSATSGTAPGTAVWNVGTGPANVTQAGGLSPYRTMGQAGNVWEWEETETDLVNDSPQGLRGVRGSDDILTLTDLGLSSSFRNESLPFRTPNNGGFRVASVIPEPSALRVAMSIGFLGFVNHYRRIRLATVGLSRAHLVFPSRYQDLNVKQ